MNDRMESKRRVLKDMISFMKKHEKGSLEEKKRAKFMKKEETESPKEETSEPSDMEGMEEEMGMEKQKKHGPRY